MHRKGKKEGDTNGTDKKKGKGMGQGREEEAKNKKRKRKDNAPGNWARAPFNVKPARFTVVVLQFQAQMPAIYITLRDCNRDGL